MWNSLKWIPSTPVSTTHGTVDCLDLVPCANLGEPSLRDTRTLWVRVYRAYRAYRVYRVYGAYRVYKGFRGFRGFIGFTWSIGFRGRDEGFRV